MNAIVAVDEKWGIGREGELLFSIPEDMRFFKSMTEGKV
ncbi:MAG: dihydrofolate reductase, partial [Oscillospiraceae bacterium]|nr:dihydrofolate reductase [Oscillospiraceae bacterium]